MRSFKQALRTAWDRFQAGVHWFGDRMSDLLLIVVYMTLFALVAFPYRLFHGSRVTGETGYVPAGEPFQRTQFTEEW